MPRRCCHRPQRNTFRKTRRRRALQLPPDRPRIRDGLASSFPAFAALYFALFAAFGTISLFLPAFLASRGLTPPRIAVVIATGTFAQLLLGPLTGIAADAFGARRMLAFAAAATAGTTLLYIAASGFPALLAVGICYFAAIAALSPVADALALGAAVHEGRFRYGWVRGVGSAAFILGLLAGGLVIAWRGLDVAMVVGAALFLLALGPIAMLPALTSAPLALARDGVPILLAIPAFRRVLLLAALVIGSHATSDTFSVIGWRAAGIEPPTIGVLSALAVGSEIVVFTLIGPRLVQRLGAFRCIALSGAAGALRWAIMATATSLPLAGTAQLLHGLTFALTHLACMRIIATHVPERLSATAQALYATLSVGAATATITLVSGHLYGSFGATTFWLAAVLCAAAVPFALAAKRWS